MTTATLNTIRSTNTLTIDADGLTHHLNLDLTDGFLADRLTPATAKADAAIAAQLGYQRTSDYRRIGSGAFTYTATYEPHPARCTTCVNGCTHPTTAPGCEHHGCWGVHTNPATRNSCPGAAAHTL